MTTPELAATLDRIGAALDRLKRQVQDEIDTLRRERAKITGEQLRDSGGVLGVLGTTSLHGDVIADTPEHRAQIAKAIEFLARSQCP